MFVDGKDCVECPQVAQASIESAALRSQLKEAREFIEALEGCDGYNPQRCPNCYWGRVCKPREVE